jgi:hypothetical protein
VSYTILVMVGDRVPERHLYMQTARRLRVDEQFYD